MRASGDQLARQHGHRTVPVEIRGASGDLTERLMTLAEFVDQHLLAATSDASTQEVCPFAACDFSLLRLRRVLDG